MNKFLVLTLALFSFSIHFSQLDSTDYAVDDSIYFEDRPNYIGFNISPLVAGIISDYNKDVKFTLVYKRNIGVKNLRFSMNHHRTVNRFPYDSYDIISTTDTSYDARFYSIDYQSYDLRFGLEELKGYRHARLHIGADIILGYASYGEDYFTETLQQDSGGNYRVPEGSITGPTGHSMGDYLNLGVDVSFGFDWFLSDEFLFTFQMTPQFNYNILLSGTKEDDQNVLGDPDNFADFKLTYFDVMLIYKF
ncbi:hypothetical protein [Parvicella tangerina]|uniref:Outer membrane protein beta-barrel domain-containing protein n=1 Tax=Parvicella tangerina TaxID=2829795 RepID=A0A916JK88_9FLAO|nr:hypothetical protein [Parvicella tangerina]CAG5078058.1 hypothetical protein CRYO30217_00559 [Parvicella tangerina]